MQTNQTSVHLLNAGLRDLPFLFFFFFIVEEDAIGLVAEKFGVIRGKLFGSCND